MSNHSFGLPFHIAQRTYAVPKNEHKPVITELYAFLTESMKKRTLVRIFVVLLKKSNFYGTIYILTL